MPHNNDSSDDFNNTQSPSGSTPGGTPRGNDSLADIYARQYSFAQQILQDGATGPDAVHQVGELLAESRILCKQEKKVQESLFGSTVLQLCSQITKYQAVALDTNLSSFDVDAFCDGILNNVRDRENNTYDWSLLANRTKMMFKRSPVVSYMYGSFKATELPKKIQKEKVARRQTNKLAEKKEPEKVTTVKATDEGNDKAVQHLNKILKKQFKRNGNQPISFFDFVLDPTSFHHTVENIFHLSFLMKNNLCRIKQDNAELPYIHPVAPSEVNELQKGKKQQCVVSISEEKWQTLVKVFEIKQAMVPIMT